MEKSIVNKVCSKCKMDRLVNSFDLINKKQVKKACHWFNLQPLWAKENLSKHDKIIAS